MKVETLHDVEQIEATPLARRLGGETGYEWLRATASRFPERAAITALNEGDPLGEGRNVSFSELLENVNRTANMLNSRGLQANESVTHFLPLVPETFYVMIAAETVAIVNPVNPMLEVDHIVGITRSANTRILVLPSPGINAEIYDKGRAVAEANSDIHTVYVLGGADECDGERFFALEASIEEQQGSAIVNGDLKSGSRVVAYFHTGGTTGLPKLAQHTQSMRVAQVVSTGLMMDYNEHDCMVLGLPMFHVAGSIICGLIPLLCGSRVLLMSPTGYRDKEAVRQFWKLVERYGVSKLMAVPTVLSALLNVPVDNADLSSLCSILTGGAAVPTGLIKAMSDKLGIEVGQGFGMTEIAGMGLLQPWPDVTDRGSTGIRCPYIDVKITTENPDGSAGRDASADEIGILCFSGPCIMPGYAGGQAQAETFTEDGWLNTGDLARMDADGKVWITGRAKDQIIRSGHNIDAIVIEEALYAHPGVEVAAAVGKPDEYAGELPIVYVQLKPEHTVGADELAEFAKERIVERAAAPTEVILMDVMPKTGFDKVFKPALRFDAIQRTFEQRIAENPEIEVDASVRVDNDPSVGVLATVLLRGNKSGRQQDLVISTLKLFSTRVTVQWMDDPSPGSS